MHALIDRQNNIGFPWPTVGQLLKIRQTRSANIGRRIRVFFALALAQRHAGSLDVLAQNFPQAIQLFQHSPNLFRTITDHYVDARLNTAARIRLIAKELRFVMEWLQKAGFAAFSPKDIFTIWQSGDNNWRVDFQINTLTPQEGLWLLMLKDHVGMPVYALSFAHDADSLLVGAVQGPRGELAMEHVRRATKGLHGLRPHFFLMEVLRTLGQTWGVTKVVGIDPQHHFDPIRLASQKKSSVKFNYIGFWQESGGILNPSRGWEIPLVGQRKSMDEIESKKRAMYRRRFALLDGLADEVKTASLLGKNLPGG